MRHNYRTEALILGRLPNGEASATVFLLTREFGLVRARAQGLRKEGAKLAAALQTFCESEVTLVRGKETWRLAGASLIENWSTKLDLEGRTRAGRVAQLLIRLMRGESDDASIYGVMQGLLASLPGMSETDRDGAECLAALRLLQSLGLDAGDIPGEEGSYDATTLAQVVPIRSELISRVNRGISASGL